MQLQDLKKKSPTELLKYAEELGIENAASMRTQDMMYAILKHLAETETTLLGEGVLEVMPDGFGFLRSPEANYLAGPDDIYVAPQHIKRWGLRTGDTVSGQISAPKNNVKNVRPTAAKNNNNANFFNCSLSIPCFDEDAIAIIRLATACFPWVVINLETSDIFIIPANINDIVSFCAG